MEFKAFFERCQNESTVSDFESYLAHCIFEKQSAGAGGQDKISLEMYSFIRDQAFEHRDKKAAQFLYETGGAASWEKGEWEGALR